MRCMCIGFQAPNERHGGKRCLLPTPFLNREDRKDRKENHLGLRTEVNIFVMSLRSWRSLRFMEGG